MNRFAIRLLAVAVLFGGGFCAWAHLPCIAAAMATLEPDGKYLLDLTFDVPPFVLNVDPQAATDDAMNAWLNGPTNTLAASLATAQSRFVKEFAVVTDKGAGSVDKIIFPSIADLERYKESVPIIQLPVMLPLTVKGKLPAGTRSVSFHFPAVMGIVAITVNRPGQTPSTLVANSGETTEPVPVLLESTKVNPPNAKPVAEPGRWLVARQILAVQTALR